MNKQEAIEELEENKRDYKATALDIHWNNALNVAINIIKQLDEPKKPVLNKYEAEWIEGLKKEQELRPFCTRNSMLYFITRCGFGYGFSYDHKGEEVELTHYHHDSHVERERLMNAFLYGYEVEKEKVYTVKFSNEDFGKTYIGIIKTANKIGISTVPINDECSKCYFTKSELEEFKFWDNPAFEIKEVTE